MNDIPTPLTDAVTEYEGGFPHPMNRQLVRADFARTLERRVAVLREALSEIVHFLDIPRGLSAAYRMQSIASKALAATEEKP